MIARGRVAGVDTREARSTASVRWAARAAALITGPGWLAAAATPVAWRDRFEMPSGTDAWVTVGLLCAGALAGLVAWRRDPLTARARFRLAPAGSDAVLVMMLLSLMVWRPRDPALVVYVLPLGPALAGWAVGRAARLAATACVPSVRSAAVGVTVSGALAGLLGAVHLGLVLTGDGGPSRAAAWAFAYCAAALVSLVRLGSCLAEDRARATRREARLRDASGDPDAALTCASLSIAFGDNRVLRGASLTVAPGELVALVGGNGAGKSTLLRIAAGLLLPDAGRVLLGGEDISELLPEERAATGLAFVSGARPVFADLSVADNLRVAAFRTHPTSRSFERATAAVLDLVPALAARRDAKAGVLSGGEQRLLAVAQTLYRRPAVLLADELSLGLDTEARVAVIELLRLLADEGVATIVVDHDLPTLLPRADRAALLTDGTITDIVPATGVLRSRVDLIPATFLVEAAR